MSTDAVSSMSNKEIIGTSLTLASGLSNAYGAYATGQMQANQSLFQGRLSKTQSEWNATLLETEAEGIKEKANQLRGIVKSNYAKAETERQSFVQRKRIEDERNNAQVTARLAKSGVVVDEGTGLDLRVESAVINELDTIETYRKMGSVNRDALIQGLSQVESMFEGVSQRKMQAISERYQGSMAEIGASLSASTYKNTSRINTLSTLLNTGTKLYAR